MQLRGATEECGYDCSALVAAEFIGMPTIYSSSFAVRNAKF